jgi:hypothetical protein
MRYITAVVLFTIGATVQALPVPVPKLILHLDNFWGHSPRTASMTQVLQPLSKVSSKLTAVGQTPTWEISTLTGSGYRPTDTKEKRFAS